MHADKTKNQTNGVNLREEIVGIHKQVPLLDGTWRPYVNLDNAASTPPLRRVKEKVDEMMEVYSSVHRGAGFKSLLSTHLYDQARQVVADFVGADLATETVIFVKNTSEAINKLANRYPFAEGDIVITTVMEHHSDDLPWRAKARVLYAGTLADGSLDVADLYSKIEQHAGKVKLVAVTGASNVTGYIPPIYAIAEFAHQHGAQILVDCAQLLPHRPVHMGPASSSQHLDFIVLSAHKIYAPFGTGALLGPREFFNVGAPDHRGGGTVEIVTLDEVHWAKAPERDEAGSPNVIGAVALATALTRLAEVGMETIAAHEAELTRYALERLNRIQGLRLFGSRDPQRVAERVGVIPFEVIGVPHAKVAAILSFEGGIGVRDGCFCAHPYVLRLLNISPAEYQHFYSLVMDNDRSSLPGFVRASFGCYNNFDDVDRLVEMLERIIAGDYQGDYVLERRTGEYFPRGFERESLNRYFSF